MLIAKRDVQDYSDSQSGGCGQTSMMLQLTGNVVVSDASASLSMSDEFDHADEMGSRGMFA